jgi:hypothetical protein
MGKREKGFALMTVLIFFLVLLILGVGGAIITQMGFFSITSEVKYARAEKNANIGLMEALESEDCSNDTSEGIFGGYRVIATKDQEHNYCFVWSEGRYWGAKVVKTSIFPLKRWAAVIFRKLDELKEERNTAIVGYDPEGNNSCSDTSSCTGHALLVGNPIYPKEKKGKRGKHTTWYTQIACYNDLKNQGGLISTINPFVYDEDLQNLDLTPWLFKVEDIKTENGSKLFEKLSQSFQVSFNNDGTPTGLVYPEINLSVNSCIAEGITITCGERGNADIFTWNSERGVYRYNKDGKDYSKIDFGNAQITFNSFSGGGYIAGKNINFNKDANVNPDSPLVLVARERITLSKNDNNINIFNTFMFSQGYEIYSNFSIIKNGIICSGGAKGKLDINIKGGHNTQLGTYSEPILIISNNIEGINIEGAGHVDIWGVIFVTDTNNKFSLEEKGGFSIHGVIINNSNSPSSQNTINLKSNSDIRFNFKVLENLYKNLSQFNLLRSPICYNKKNLFILTTMRTY